MSHVERRESPTLTNPRSDRVASVRALSRRSVRLKAGRYLVEGPQGVREAVVHAPETVLDVYVTDEGARRHPEILERAHAERLYVHPVTDEVLQAMCDATSPQGIAAVCRTEHHQLEDVLAAGPRLLLVLTHVRDPGNAGTAIRAADAAGADAVLVSEGSVDIHSPKVVRSTAGSLAHLPVVTGLDVPDLLARLRDAGIATFAADGRGARTVDEVDLTVPHAWVMGNEAWGLTDEDRDACDEVVRVPIHGKAESLNLAMAATICVYASARVRPPV